MKASPSEGRGSHRAVRQGTHRAATRASQRTAAQSVQSVQSAQPTQVTQTSQVTLAPRATQPSQSIAHTITSHAAAWLRWQAWLGALLAMSMLLTLGVSGLSGIVMPRAQAQEQPSVGANPSAGTGASNGATPNSTLSASNPSSTTPSTPATSTTLSSSTAPDTRIVDPNVISSTQSNPNMVSGNSDPTDTITIKYVVNQGDVITVQSPMRGSQLWHGGWGDENWGANGNNVTLLNVSNATLKDLGNGMTQITFNADGSSSFVITMSPHMGIGATQQIRPDNPKILQPGDYTVGVTLQQQSTGKRYKADTTFHVQPDIFTSAQSWKLDWDGLPQKDSNGNYPIVPNTPYSFSLWDGDGWMRGENFAPNANAQNRQHYTWNTTKMAINLPGGFKLLPSLGFTQPGGVGTTIYFDPSQANSSNGNLNGEFTDLNCPADILTQIQAAEQSGQTPSVSCPPITTTEPSTMSAYFSYETKPRTITLDKPMSIVMSIATPKGEGSIGPDNTIMIPTKSNVLRPNQGFNYQYRGSFSTKADSSVLYNVRQELPAPDGSNEVGLNVSWTGVKPDRTVSVVATMKDGTTQTFTKTFTQNDIDSGGKATFAIPTINQSPDANHNPYTNFVVTYSQMDPSSSFSAQVTAQSKTTFTDGTEVTNAAVKPEQQRIAAWTTADPARQDPHKPELWLNNSARVTYSSKLINNTLALTLSRPNPDATAWGSMTAGQWYASTQPNRTFKIDGSDHTPVITVCPVLGDEKPSLQVKNSVGYFDYGSSITTQVIYEPVVSFLLPAGAQYSCYQLPEGAPAPQVTVTSGSDDVDGLYQVVDATGQIAQVASQAKQRVVTFDWTGTGYWAHFAENSTSWPTVVWSLPRNGLSGKTQEAVFISTKNDPQLTIGTWPSYETGTPTKLNPATIEQVQRGDPFMKLVGDMDIYYNIASFFGSTSRIINNQNGGEQLFAVNSLNKGQEHTLVTKIIDTDKDASKGISQLYQFTNIPQAGASGGLQLQVQKAGYVEDVFGNTLPDSVAQIYYCTQTHDIKTMTAASAAALASNDSCKTAAQMSAGDWANVKSVLTVVKSQPQPNMYNTHIPLVAPNIAQHGLGDTVTIETVGLLGSLIPLYSSVRDTFVNLAGVKSWQNPDGTAAEAPKDASVVVGLYKAVQGADGAWTADGGDAAQPVASVTLNAANGWTFDFATMPNVPLVDATTQQPIKYIVKEQNVPEGHQMLYGCDTGVASADGEGGESGSSAATNAATCGAKPFMNHLINRKVSLAVSMLPMTGAAQSHAWLATLVLVVLGAAGMTLFGSLGFGLRRLGIRGSGTQGFAAANLGLRNFTTQARRRKHAAC